MNSISIVVLLFCFKGALLTDPACVIDLECRECVPENMPLVTSHRAANGTVRVEEGDELALSCGAGHFLALPRRELRARCDQGRYRVPGLSDLTHLLDLGCQESVFEDVLHQVEDCAPPLQGRAYLVRAGEPRHVATVCFDADRGVATRLRMTSAPHNALRMRSHEHSSAPLSILGNFNHMFDAKTRHDAERLYSDDLRMNRRVHELLKHDHYSFADQTLTSAKLLSAHYFEDQNMGATEFVSNRVAVWRSVAEGNLRHMQRDIAALVRRARAHTALEVSAGVHGAWRARGGAALRLRAARFPVARYVWSVVHAPALRRAVALVVLNDPFVAVSEIRAAVFCDSACGRVSWLHELHRQRRYEVPLYGLTFCCTLSNFTSLVTEMTTSVQVPDGDEGMLTDLFIPTD